MHISKCVIIFDILSYVDLDSSQKYKLIAHITLID